MPQHVCTNTSDMADLNARQQTLEFLKGQNAARLAAGLQPIGVGIDMSTGRQVTDQNYLQKIFGLNQGELIPTTELAQMGIDSQAEIKDALAEQQKVNKEPDKTITEQAEDIVKAAQIIAPFNRQLEQQRIGDMFGLYTGQVLPAQLAAAQAATDRNLAASQLFLATREKMPSTQQMIAASRQGQMTDAARAFATEAAAIAGQQDAASRFASLGTMRRYGR